MSVDTLETMRPRRPRRGPSFVASYVLVLAVLLAAPIGTVHAKRGYLREFHHPVSRRAMIDAAINIAVFVPLGWSLKRALRLRGFHPGAVNAILVVGAVGAGFSLTMETLQHFLPTRHSSIVDTAYNAVGAVIGAVAHHSLD